MSLALPISKARTALESLVKYARKSEDLGGFDHLVTPFDYSEEVIYGDFSCDGVTLIYSPTSDDGRTFGGSGQIPNAQYFSVMVAIVLPDQLCDNEEEKVYRMIDLQDLVKKSFRKDAGTAENPWPVDHQSGLSQLRISSADYIMDPESKDYIALLPLRLFYTNA